MTFKATFPTIADYEGADSDTYEFLDGGVLALNISGVTYYYAPQYWNRVITEDGHKPGKKNTPGKVAMV